MKVWNFLPISSADELMEFSTCLGRTIGPTIATCLFSSSFPLIPSFRKHSSMTSPIDSDSLLLMYSGAWSNFRCRVMNGDESRKLWPVTDPWRLIVPSLSFHRCAAAFDCLRLSHRMLLLSDAPKFVMQEIEGCLESLMYLGLLRGRQNKGGGRSRKSTLRFSIAPSVVPVGNYEKLIKAWREILRIYGIFFSFCQNFPMLFRNFRFSPEFSNWSQNFLIRTTIFRFEPEFSGLC